MADFTSLETWGKGLIAAIIGGVSNSITLMIVDPMTFNLQTGLGHLFTVAGTSAILAAAMYLKQSPIPSIAPAEVKSDTTPKV
jgi:hypothetical protein